MTMEGRSEAGRMTPMFFVKFLILFVLIPAVMIVLSSAVGPASRIGITYFLFPAVLLAIVLVRFAKEDRQL